jgi:hypothetical protein
MIEIVLDAGPFTMDGCRLLVCVHP